MMMSEPFKKMNAIMTKYPTAVPVEPKEFEAARACVYTMSEDRNLALRTRACVLRITNGEILWGFFETPMQRRVKYKWVRQANKRFLKEANEQDS